MNQSFVIADCNKLMYHLKEAMATNRKVAEERYETFVQNNVRNFLGWKIRSEEQVRRITPFEEFFTYRWYEEIRLIQALYGMIRTSSTNTVNLTIQ